MIYPLNSTRLVKMVVAVDSRSSALPHHCGNERIPFTKPPKFTTVEKHLNGARAGLSPSLASDSAAGVGVMKIDARMINKETWQDRQIAMADLESELKAKASILALDHSQVRNEAEDSKGNYSATAASVGIAAAIVSAAAGSGNVAAAIAAANLISAVPPFHFSVSSASADPDSWKSRIFRT